MAAFAFGVDRQAKPFRDGAGLHHFVDFAARDEAVFVPQAVHADIADADKGHVRAMREFIDDSVQAVIGPLRAFGFVVGHERRGQHEVLAAGFFGKLLRDVVAIRRAVLRDGADQRDEAMLRTVELADLRDAGLERSAAADGDDERLFVEQIALHDLRACDGQFAVHLFGRVAVDGDDFAHMVRP